MDLNIVLFVIALLSTLGLTFVTGYYFGVRNTVSYYSGIFKNLNKSLYSHNPTALIDEDVKGRLDN